MAGEVCEKREDLATKFKFPDGYNYLEVGKSDVIRIKQITDEKSAKKWLTLYSLKSNTIWRLARSYPDSGKVNVFKVAWKCHHNVQIRPNSKNRRRSKHTNCPAKMLLTVKRFVANSKAKKPDHLTEYWPCILSFNLQHNHLNTFEVSRSKLDAAKTDIYEIYANRLGVMFVSTGVDSIPKSISTDNTDTSTKLSPPRTDSDDLVMNTETDIENDMAMETKENLDLHLSETDDENECRTVALSAENEEKLTKLFRRIRNGLQNNPSAFVPAVNEMLNNIDKFAQTENAFLSALHEFADNHSKTPKTYGRNPHNTENRIRIIEQPVSLPSKNTTFEREEDNCPFGFSYPLNDHDYSVLTKYDRDYTFDYRFDHDYSCVLLRVL